MRRAKKAVLGVAGATVVAIGAMGALHMPFARPLLMRLGGCPASGISPVAIDAARRPSIVAARGPTVAPARPALGFALDEATLADVHAWADRVGATCEDKREATLIRCKDGAMEITFGLSAATRRVVAVTTLRSQLTGLEGANRMKQLGNELHAKLGAPTTTAGDPNALATDGYHTATFSYAYSDYLASVTATRLPERGVIVREEYFSAR